MACENCSCKNYVKVSGSNLSERIKALTNFKGLMVIGESPTAIEATKGRVMTGSGAKVLKETLQKVGMPSSESEVYYTTAFKCAIPKKKGHKIPKDAPGMCRDFLLQEIRTVKPKMILVCGASALQTLTGIYGIKVTEQYGRVLNTSLMDDALKATLKETYDKITDVQILPIMNPGVLIHKPGDYKPFLSYLTLASTLFKGGEEADTGETKWIVIDTVQAAKELWTKMHNDYKAGKFEVAAYDVETTGLDYRIAEFCVLGICYEKNISYVIPRELALRNVVHNFIEGVPWRCIWQNGKFDKKILWRRQLGTVSIDEDTELMHYALDETSSHDLGYLTKVYLNAAEYKYKMNQNWKAVSLETYPQFFDALCERVAVDCDYTLQLYWVLKEELDKPENAPLKNVYKKLLIPAANMLTRIEENGCLIDSKYLGKLDEQYQALLTDIVDEIHQLAEPFWDPDLYRENTGAKSAPPVFNPGSPQQMAWMVFDRLKLKPRVKKGRSTAVDILESIDNPPKLVSKVLEYRTVQKEHSTYVLGLLKAQDKDGRVRTSFTLHVTATGRLSSKEPNIQNQPATHGLGNIRKAFIAPKDYILGEIDYSGAELRWLAFLSKDETLLKIFQEGRNLHKETATKMFGPHFTPANKMIAKALNFGIAYGREAKSIADDFNISNEEAQGHIDNWFKAYPGAHEYLEWCAKQVELGNYLETPWGRRRRFGIVTPASLHSLQNEAKNFPIQSSSSDTLLWCCIQHEGELAVHGIKIINLIHDSALVEIPAKPEIVQWFGIHMNAWMTQVPVDLFDCPVPFSTDFEVGLTWGDLSGTEFNYDEDITSKKLLQREMPDDSLKYYSWDDWYQEQLNNR